MNKYKFYNLNDLGKINEYIYKERLINNMFVSWGDDNNYPKFVLELLNKSAIHSAILNRKTLMIAGNGVEDNDIDEEFVRIINNEYNKYSLNEILYKIAYDLELFGGFSFEVLLNKDMNKIVEINYLPIYKLRFSEDMKYVYYKNDWDNYNSDYIKIPVFDFKNINHSQVYIYKEYRPGVEYYPIPSYISAVNWIELEWEISNFHLNQVKKGFFPSMILSLNNGIPSDEEMEDIVKGLKKQYEGALNEVVMFMFSEDKNHSVDVHPIQLNNSDERFIELMKQIMQHILTAHQVTAPILMGVATPGSLSNKKELIEAVDSFYSLYIKPKQIAIENIFNKILKFNGSKSVMKLKKYEI